MKGWDFRHWVALGLFVQSSSLFYAIARQPSLADNQGFMVLATAVVVTGWIGGVVAFAFAAGIEAVRSAATADKALDLAQAQAAVPSGRPDDPISTRDAP
jgi:hypothetical protein